MDKQIQFIVPAVPVAQPRPRATLARGGKGARIHEVTHVKNPRTGERKQHPINAFKAAVQRAAHEAYDGAPLEGPIYLGMRFVMPRPKRLIWKSKPMPRVWHEQKPDDDNLRKAVKDALSKIVWRDDSQVCRTWSEKVIASGDEQPHVEIEIEQCAGQPR